jgi:hypothetical protein
MEATATHPSARLLRDAAIAACVPRRVAGDPRTLDEPLTRPVRSVIDFQQRSANAIKPPPDIKLAACARVIDDRLGNWLGGRRHPDQLLEHFIR